MSELFSNFKEIVINEIPLIDVRAPIEFEKGAFKTSVNMPIMDNEQRRLVGIKYKQEGNDKATELGYKLVSGEIKEARIKAWIDFIEQNPNAIVNCFRGGSRSRISQGWINEVLNSDIPRLDGGYKAFRNYLIENLDPNTVSMKPIILGGYTGTGKTILLNKLNNKIDLEGLANHRGSSFGRHATAQPTQINFENNLAYALIQNQEKGFKHMIVEDEGVHVGQCYLPKPLYYYINSGDLVILDEEIEKRVEITLNEYIIEAQKEYINIQGDFVTGMNSWYEYIVNSIIRLKKRLGGVKLETMLESVNLAFKQQMENGDVNLHRDWIKFMLEEYYDPMYKYQIENNTKTIIFRGNEQEVFEFLSEKL